MPPSPNDLKGIGVSCPLSPPDKCCTEYFQRGSSIDLDDEALHVISRCIRKTPPSSMANGCRSYSYNPDKPPLLPLRPHELYCPYMIREPSPENGCPLFPEDSSPSPPPTTGVLPLQAYLDRDEKYENLLMRNYSYPPFEKKSLAHMQDSGLISKGRSDGPSSCFSWEIVDQPSCSDPARTLKFNGPPLQPIERQDEPSVLHLDEPDTVLGTPILPNSMYPEYISTSSSQPSSANEGSAEEHRNFGTQDLSVRVRKHRRAFDQSGENDAQNEIETTRYEE